MQIADSEPCPTVAASPRALFAAGVGGAHPTPLAGGVSANRFFHLGTESELESSTQEICMVRRRPSCVQEEISPTVAQSLVEVDHAVATQLQQKCMEAHFGDHGVVNNGRI